MKIMKFQKKIKFKSLNECIEKIMTPLQKEKETFIKMYSVDNDTEESLKNSNDCYASCLEG